MAILRSVDGKFYEVPDKDLSKFEVPPEKVKDLMAEAGGPAGGGSPPPGQGGGAAPPQIVVHISGGGAQMGGGPPQADEGGDAGVQPYYCWRNYHVWRNCGWRNCY